VSDTNANRLTLSEARQRQEQGVQAARESVPASEQGEVPTGGIKSVQEWVGDDTGRAQRALDAETAKPEDDQRSSLIEWLERIVANG
jgi:hypothetical protein